MSNKKIEFIDFSTTSNGLTNFWLQCWTLSTFTIKEGYDIDIGSIKENEESNGKIMKFNFRLNFLKRKCARESFLRIILVAITDKYHIRSINLLNG